MKVFIFSRARRGKIYYMHIFAGYKDTQFDNSVLVEKSLIEFGRKTDVFYQPHEEVTEALKEVDYLKMKQAIIISAFKDELNLKNSYFREISS